MLCRNRIRTSSLNWKQRSETTQCLLNNGLSYSGTDAVQAAGKLPVRLPEIGASSSSISAHKLHGPKGVGALYISRRSGFTPTIIGGDQENSRRAGTENVAGIVGFGKAAELATAAWADYDTRVRAMRDRFEQALLAAIPGVVVNGGAAPRLPNTSSISFPGVESEAVLMLLDRQNLCCSAGSACLTGSREGSHVLRAMNASDERVRGSLRFSWSRLSTVAETSAAIDLVVRAITKLRAMAS